MKLDVDKKESYRNKSQHAQLIERVQRKYPCVDENFIRTLNLTDLERLDSYKKESD